MDRRYGGWSKWQKGNVEWVGGKDGGLGTRWGGSVGRRVTGYEMGVVEQVQGKEGRVDTGRVEQVGGMSR